MYTIYDVYKVFKEVESEVKNKPYNPLSEEGFMKKTSEKNIQLIQDIANVFNTRFVNVNLREYIKCGFHHFKSFGYDKMFREIVLKEYISRDSRAKRNTSEPISKIISDIKHINRPLEKYVNEYDGQERVIIKDYMMGSISSTMVAYCIWRNLLQPNEMEWTYLNTIKNNFPAFEKNVVKFATMIDKWRKDMKETR